MAPLNNQRVIYLKYLISNMESLGTWHQVNTSHPSGVQAGLDFFLNTCVDNIKNLLSCGKKKHGNDDKPSDFEIPTGIFVHCILDLVGFGNSWDISSSFQSASKQHGLFLL